MEEDLDDTPNPRLTRRRSGPITTQIESQVAASSPFKKIFLRRHRIEMNWRCKPIRPPKHLKGHDDHVITCLLFDGNTIVSGSDDNTLKVWSAVTGKIVRTLVGHTGKLIPLFRF